MRSKRTSVVVVAIALTAALGGCRGSNEPKAGGTAANAVRIAGFLFKPEKLDVAAGATVTWTNADDIEHTITAGTPEAPGGAFDSGNKSKGQTFSHTFTSAGSFTYFCRNHKSMRGEVAVT